MQDLRNPLRFQKSFLISLNILKNVLNPVSAPALYIFYFKSNRKKTVRKLFSKHSILHI